MSAVTGRFLLISGALLLFADAALGDGTFQRTRNGKTLVWNNHPQPGDEAAWSGGRDRDGYARGFGTLIWYTTEQSESGSTKPALYARYYGNMVRGKFSGPVNVHSKKKTHYAIFADGVRSTHWVAGRAPSRIERPEFAEAMKKALAARKAENVELPTPNAQPRIMETRAAEPEPPAEGPLGRRSEVREATGRRPESTQLSTFDSQLSEGTPGDQDNELSPKTGKIDIDDSLRLLAWPPRHLRTQREEE